MQPTFSRESLDTDVFQYLLDITFAGTNVRLATDDITVSSDSGDLHYHGLLLSSIQDALTADFLTNNSDGTSIPIATLFPFDLAEMVRRGYSLSNQDAEVSRLRIGDSYEDRTVILRGRIIDPNYGNHSEAINFSIQEALFDDKGLLPKADMVVSTKNWPNAATNAQGKSYPVVINTPGMYDTDHSTGSPALFVDTTGGSEKLLVAGHECLAATVRIFDIANNVGESFACVYTTDAVGRKVTIVDISGAAVITIDANSDYAVVWNNGGGLPNATRLAPLKGAGEVIEWLLLNSTLRYDVGRFAAIRGYLNTFELAFTIVESISPWDFIVNNLLDILPITLITGPDGLRPVLWRFDMDVNDTVEILDCDNEPGISRNSAIQETSTEVINEIKLKFGLSFHTRYTQRYAIVTGANPYSDDNISLNYFCKVSQGRYGVYSKEIESIVICLRATAIRVLNIMARRRALPTRKVAYLTPQRYANLDLGQAVSLTDSDVSFNNDIALIEGKTTQADSGILFALRLLDDIPLGGKVHV